MKPGKLLAAVRRELVANPKKAAVLALLLAAAAWFWGPIVWRMVGGSKPPSPAQAQVASSQSPATRTNAAIPAKAAVHWRDLLAARRDDPLAQSATFDPAWPQPFKVQALQATAANGERTQVALTPAQAGLVLQSIVYGNTKRAAMINGRVYREGAEVAVAAAGAPVTFQVIHIDRSSVSLERYGRTYRLEFPRPRLLSNSSTGPLSPQPLAPAGGQP